MARRSLKAQLNQIRNWVRQGRTDAWIAHQLEVPVKDIDGFKREHDLAPAESTDGGGEGEGPVVIEEVDLRAEDDALIAAELDAEPEPEPEPELPQDEGDEGDRPRRRRGRRGGRGRRTRAAGTPLEGTFDHGEEGYGLWLDPAVQDDPVYAEHWAGHRPVTVTIESDQIVIRRAGEELVAEAAPAPAAADPEPVEAVIVADPDEGLEPTDPVEPVEAVEPPDAAIEVDPDEATAVDVPMTDELAEQELAAIETIDDVLDQDVAPPAEVVEDVVPEPEPEPEPEKKKPAPRRRSRSRKKVEPAAEPEAEPGTTMNPDDFDA